MSWQKKLTEDLYDTYWRDKQKTWIASIEVMEGNNPVNGPLSIYTINTEEEWFEHYLFDVRNYGSFYEEVPRIKKSILYPRTLDLKYRWDVVGASSSIFYNARERMYTIPKFTSITREDILRCFEHFKVNALDYCLLFNVRWYEFKEGTYKQGDEQHEFPFMHRSKNI